ncbi:hypothetical protein AS035_04700 [Bacillus altitudinis]|nr:hypothetical protein AS035_04700 [Bacillus altitudinis]
MQTNFLLMLWLLCNVELFEYVLISLSYFIASKKPCQLRHGFTNFILDLYFIEGKNQLIRKDSLYFI